MLIRLLYLLRNVVMFIATAIPGVIRFVYGLIPCGGLFGIPGAVIKPFVFLMFVLALLGSCTGGKSRRAGSSAPAAAQEIAEGVEPVSGRTRYYVRDIAAATLRVRAVGLNCLVELFDVRTQNLVLDVYVKAGRMEDVQVPAGRFGIRYQAGSCWTGGARPFGCGTRRSCEPSQVATFDCGTIQQLTVGEVK